MARRSRLLSLGFAGLGVAVVSLVAAMLWLTVRCARLVVTPPRRHSGNIRILAADERTITLSATADSLTPGQYGFWFHRDSGHARIGEILECTDKTVTRELLAVDFGTLTGARNGRMGGWFYLKPDDLSLPWEEVELSTELGPTPAWLIPAETESKRWVIQVHGRATTRQEALRSVPTFRAAGYTSLLISYRNDTEAPASPDRRYALGATEWRDVDVAMRFAIDHGANEIVLMGWSMGGATILQALIRSELSSCVRGVVLDSPVIDWVTALSYQAEINRLPSVIREGVFALLSTNWGARITGLQHPIDFERLDLVTRARELSVPILLMHSEDDGFIPVTASVALAQARPDIVSFEHFRTARHARLWNYDQPRWESAVSRWLQRLE